MLHFHFLYLLEDFIGTSLYLPVFQESDDAPEDASRAYSCKDGFLWNVRVLADFVHEPSEPYDKDGDAELNPVPVGLLDVQHCLPYVHQIALHRFVGPQVEVYAEVCVQGYGQERKGECAEPW